MSAVEINNWLAYEISCDPDFQKRVAETPKALMPEEEADAIKQLFQGL